MDVLLIQPKMPPPIGRMMGFEGVMPPMGLLCLAKPLVDMGIDVQILDFTVTSMNRQQFIQYLEHHKPRVVGITALTETANRGKQIAGYVKETNPEIKVVMGGAHATFMARELLNNPNIDVAVRGEGDRSFTQLVNHYLFNTGTIGDIRGISFRENGGITETETEFITDIDSLSFPSRALIDLSDYPVKGTISASRGCPFKCKFCSVVNLSGRKYRIRSIESVMEEVDYLVSDLGCSYLYFLDDTLTPFRRRLENLCETMIERDYGVTWFCESRVDVIDKKMLELMHRAGCREMQLGFESASQVVLDAIGKRITPDQMENAVNLCLETGIKPSGNFIIGFPEDTEETVKATTEMAIKLTRRGLYIGFGVVTPFPGTHYYDHAEELGIDIHAGGWDDYLIGIPIISTPNFSRDRLREIAYDTLLEINRCTGTGKSMFTLS